MIRRLLVALAVTAAGCGAQPATTHPARPADSPRTTHPAACPDHYFASPPWVPHEPATIDRQARLVPLQKPHVAVVCRYPQTAKKSPLRGRRVLTGDLSRIPDELGRITRKRQGFTHPCTMVYRQSINYLLALSYSDGRPLWVSITDDVNHCTDAWNGVFRTWSDVAPDVISAFRTGRWPGRADQSCAQSRLIGRLGQERTMVPAGSTSLIICDREDHSYRLASGYGHLVAVLNHLPTRTAGWSCSPSPPASAPAYRLLFGYRTGPAALVDVLAGCFPEITNLSLESRSATTVVPLVDELLRARPAS